VQLQQDFGELAGRADWTLRVRDLDVGEEAVDRDFEDIVLGTTLDGLRVAGPPDSSGRVEIYGGLERDRVRLTETEDGLVVRVPEGSPLDPAGLVALRGRLDLAGLAPPPEALAEGAGPEDRRYTLDLAVLDELFFPLGHPATLLAPKGWARVTNAEVPTGGPVSAPEGELKGTWLPPEDGSGPGVVDLDLDVTIELDPVSALAATGQAWLDGRDLETFGGLAEDPEARASVRLLGEGTMTWDPGTGRFGQLDLALELAADVRGDLTWQAGTWSRDVGIRAKVVGEIALAYRYTVGAARR